jgi:RimJ/RimL family protein N-acetyltransferase
LEAPDLGFALLPRYRRRGLTAEAARAVLAHGRRDLGLKRVLAITSLENTASIELLTGLGFVWERHLHRENQQLNVLGRQQ